MQVSHLKLFDNLFDNADNGVDEEGVMMKNVKLPDGPSAHCSQLCFVPHPPSPPRGVHVQAFHKQPVSYGVMSSRWRL